MGLAAANKSRLGPAVALGKPRAFRQALVSEYALIVGVLAITATMTSLFSPNRGMCGRGRPGLRTQRCPALPATEARRPGGAPRAAVRHGLCA